MLRPLLKFMLRPFRVSALSDYGPFRLRPFQITAPSQDFVPLRPPSCYGPSCYGPLHVTALHVTAPRGYNPSQRCSSGAVSYPYKKPSAKKARPSYMAETTKVMISCKKDAPPLKSLNKPNNLPPPGAIFIKGRNNKIQHVWNQR